MISVTFHKCTKSILNINSYIRIGKLSLPYFNCTGSCHNEFNRILPGTDSSNTNYWHSFFWWQLINFLNYIVNNTKSQRLKSRT